MDCQKFDLVVMDALYEELDELTYAALRRHVESCSRCGEIWSGLRATRDAVSLPIEEPADDLEERILAAVNAVQARTPWHRKALRGLAWAGSHAMRPQLAMAALFVLVIGSSLLLLRAKPGTVGISPVRVTERGVPAPDEGDLAQAPAAAPLQAAAAAPAAPPPAEGATDKPKDEADKLADKAAAAPNADAVKALADARAARDRSGCDAAVRAYDDVGARFPATPQAADAMWEAAQCQKSLGNNDKARELLLSLKSSEGYKERADEALRDTDSAATNNAGQAVASRGSAAAAAPPAAATAAGAGATGKAVAAEEQAQRTKAAPGGGPGRNVTAAPAPKRAVSVDAAY